LALEAYMMHKDYRVFSSFLLGFCFWFLIMIQSEVSVQQLLHLELQRCTRRNKTVHYVQGRKKTEGGGRKKTEVGGRKLCCLKPSG
jgi:hypothetical protein